MAYPVVLSTTFQSYSAGTTHNVAMPATVEAGDLLRVVIWFEGNVTDYTATTPAGFTEILNTRPGIARVVVATREADGTEDSATYNFATSASRDAASYVQRIQAGTWGGDEAADIDAAAARGSSANGDPPSVTAGWGSDDNLYSAFMMFEDNVTIDAYPSNYTAYQNSSTSGFPLGTYRFGTASRELAASSDNPGVFDTSTFFSREWLCVTVVVKPAAGASTVVKDIIGVGLVAFPR